ncbi:MAG TPA: hypothetical protein VFG76_12750, partial [Candidatus Polarisedimenticolia bacterium]|nr:hypothetical protein [Candidatus Polarisedimenticolia bacterium]
LAEGGITKGPTHALIGEAGTEVVSPIDKLLAMIKEAVAGVMLGPNLAMAGASVDSMSSAFNNFRPEPAGDVVTVIELNGKVLTRAVVENMPGVLYRKLGNAFG